MPQTRRSDSVFFKSVAVIAFAMAGLLAGIALGSVLTTMGILSLPLWTAVITFGSMSTLLFGFLGYIATLSVALDGEEQSRSSVSIQGTGDKSNDKKTKYDLSIGDPPINNPKLSPQNKQNTPHNQPKPKNKYSTKTNDEEISLLDYDPNDPYDSSNWTYTTTTQPKDAPSVTPPAQSTDDPSNTPPTPPPF